MRKSNDIIKDMFQIKQRMVTAIVSEQDELAIQSIKDYFKEKYPNEYVNITFLNEEEVNKVIKLGIEEYQRRFNK